MKMERRVWSPNYSAFLVRLLLKSLFVLAKRKIRVCEWFDAKTEPF